MKKLSRERSSPRRFRSSRPSAMKLISRLPTLPPTCALRHRPPPPRSWWRGRKISATTSNGSSDRLTGAVRGSVARLESRVHVLNRRPGFAGWSARLALRGRHCAETTYALGHAARTSVSRRVRAFQTLRLQLEQYRLAAAPGNGARAARARRRHAARGGDAPAPPRRSTAAQLRRAAR